MKICICEEVCVIWLYIPSSRNNQIQLAVGQLFPGRVDQYLTTAVT